MSIFAEILTRAEFQISPPVLVDIGASGQIHRKWKAIAPYSVCIAFDGDDRKFDQRTTSAEDFKQLHVFHSLVVDTDAEQIDFYLTRSPYCSSTLEPDANALEPWAFAKKFSVENKVSVRALTLKKALDDLGIRTIDWFKTDSQGIDLRLFQSLDGSIINKVLAAEFEPGIIHSYNGEDKLHELLRWMDGRPFWMSHAKMKGSQRLSDRQLTALVRSPFLKKLLQFSHVDSPGWMETTYLNTFEGEMCKREYLLGWIFATIERQYGFALHLARSGEEKFNDDIFVKMCRISTHALWKNLFGFKIFFVFYEKMTKVFKLA